MNKIKVSIIIPIYNVEKYIEKCLNSIINQTLKDIEIIIINDKSLDNSMSIVKKIAQNDKRIIMLENSKNLGAGKTRNKGLKIAKGEYIAFVDSDDFIDEDYYELLYNKAKKTNSDICYSNYLKYYNKNKYKKYNATPINDEDIFNSKEILYNMFETSLKQEFYVKNSTCKSIYKRDIINKYNIKFLSEREFLTEDLIFNYDFLSKCNNISFCKDVYYHYYCSNDSSQTYKYLKPGLIEAKNLRKKLIEKAKKNNDINNLKGAIENIFLRYIRCFLKYEINQKKINRKNIINIINDKTVIESLNKKNKEKLSRNIFDFLIKHKCITLIIIICKIYIKIEYGSE